MAPYYSMISCREWGTENEWVVVAIVSAVMAIIDVSSSFYGIYVFKCFFSRSSFYCCYYKHSCVLYAYEKY
ncbi:hypothetical protein [Plasmodium yoelii yoelii]|uniref:Uncharacterized protein n=1 Tax=Plasmodium yoelii yoelii TaxID=73239 RepID=Q7RAT0_PLAYO|nr:hypothetical protein [Plasmodium yoelii yoelii]